MKRINIPHRAVSLTLLLLPYDIIFYAKQRDTLIVELHRAVYHRRRLGGSAVESETVVDAVSFVARLSRSPLK